MADQILLEQDLGRTGPRFLGGNSAAVRPAERPPPNCLRGRVREGPSRLVLEVRGDVEAPSDGDDGRIAVVALDRDVLAEPGEPLQQVL